MHERSTINKIINTYTITTNIPVMFVDDLKKYPSLFSENYNYSLILEYGDIQEVVKFLESLFLKPVENDNKLFIFKTTWFLVYLIVPVIVGKNTTGAYVAGPLVPYLPDKKSADEIIKLCLFPFIKEFSSATY